MSSTTFFKKSSLLDIENISIEIAMPASTKL